MNTITTPAGVPTESQTQVFAKRYASKIAARQLRTIAAIGIASKLITMGVAVVSYRHQYNTMNGWHAPREMAIALPGLFDALTIICVLVLSTPALMPTGKKIAARIIAFPILCSSAINFAGHGTWLVKVAALSMPVLIPLAELVGSHVKPDFAAMDEIERAAYKVATPVEDPTVVAARATADARIAEAIAALQAETDRKAADRKAATQKGVETRAANRAAREMKKAVVAERRRERREADKVLAASPVSPGTVSLAELSVGELDRYL